MVFLLLLIQSLTSGISNMLLIISVTDDFSELNQHLITLYRRLNGNLMPLMQAVAGTLEDSTKQRFNSKVALTHPKGQNFSVIFARPFISEIRHFVRYRPSDQSDDDNYQLNLHFITV